VWQNIIPNTAFGDISRDEGVGWPWKKYIYTARWLTANIATQHNRNAASWGRVNSHTYRENSSQSCRGDLGNTNLQGIMAISCQPDRVFRHHRSAEPELLWTINLLLAELKQPQRTSS